MPVIPPASSRPHRTVQAVFLLGLISALPPCVPAASAAGRPPTPIPAGRPGTTWTSAEATPANCSQSRRKLWQAGEGWMVRTVTICR